MVDCNPSFAIYTQLAVAACDFLVIPFTADDSSRRAIENIVALIYGIGDPKVNAYARTSFAGHAREQGVSTPKSVSPIIIPVCAVLSATCWLSP